MHVVGVYEGVGTFGSGNTEVILTSTGGRSIFIAKYSADGGLLWAKETGVISSPEAFARNVVDASGSMYIVTPFFDTVTLGVGEANETTLTGPGSEDILIAKYSADGTLLWAKKAGGADRDRGTELALDGSGYVYISGFFSGSGTFGSGDANETTLTSVGEWDVYVAKYDGAGALEWVKSAGSENFDTIAGLSVDTSGSSYLTGGVNGTATFGEGETSETIISSTEAVAFLAKYDTDGSLVFATRTSDVGFSSDVAVDAGENIYITGSFDGLATFGPDETNETLLSSAGQSDVFISKYDAEGKFLWARRAGGTMYDLGYALDVNGAGQSIVTGTFEGTATFGLGETNQVALSSAGSSDMFLASYDSNGGFLGITRAGGFRYDAGGDIVIGPSNDIFVTGRFQDSAVFGLGAPSEVTLTSRGSNDVFTARYMFVFPSRAEEAASRDRAAGVVQNFPNPFSERTTVEISLDRAGEARLEIFDLTGRSVRVPIDGFLPAGRHERVVEAADLPSGVYLVSFRAGSVHSTGLVMLVR